MVCHALDAIDDEESIRFVRSALALRNRRYVRIDIKPSEYERGMERIEGLAHYIERLSIGRIDKQIPDKEYEPDDIRRRCYAMGAAWAQLLDRHYNGWVLEFDRCTDIPVLDRALSSLVRNKLGAGVISLAIDEDTVRSERIRAIEDIHSLEHRYHKMKKQFMSMPGWRIVIVSHLNSQLRTTGTDPSNLTLLTPTEVLHTRYLTLKSSSELDSDTLEILGASALTESDGSHPLYDGIRRVIVAGLKEKPIIIHDSGSVQIRGDGITAIFTKATINIEDETLHVTLWHLGQ